MEFQRSGLRFSGIPLPSFFEAASYKVASTWFQVASEALTPKLVEQAQRQQELLQRQAFESLADAQSRYVEAVAARTEAAGRVAEAQRILGEAVVERQRNMEEAADRIADAHRRIAEAQRSYHEVLADRQERIARAAIDSASPLGSTSSESTTRESALSEYTATSDPNAAMQLIDELLAEDPSYDQDTWPGIAEALDRDRLSNRKLFVD